MKAISVYRNINTGSNINPYCEQARQRERFWFDFRIEFELIGARLRRLRIEKGYSIESVAKAVKMSKYRLCKIEHGMYVHFDLLHLQRLSDLYDTTMVEILSVIPDGLFDDMNY